MLTAFVPGGRYASQNAFARAFPQRSMLSICSFVQVSRLTDLTRVTCVPMDLCTPEHSMHINTPRFHEAQRGSLLLQSAQMALSARSSSVPRIAWCCLLRASLPSLSALVVILAKNGGATFGRAESG